MYDCWNVKIRGGGIKAPRGIKTEIETKPTCGWVGSIGLEHRPCLVLLDAQLRHATSEPELLNSVLQIV